MYLFLQIEDEVFFGGDSGLKWLMTRQFSEGDVSPYIATHQPAWVLQLWDDGFAPFTPPFVYATPQGYLTAFPVWFSLLSTPFFLLFGTCGIYILPMVALWGLWWRMLSLCKKLQISPFSTAFALFAIIFGSPLTLYGAIFWEHTLAVLLLFFGVEYACTYRQCSALQAGVFGSLCALSAWLRPEAIIVISLLWGILFLRFLHTRDARMRTFLISSLLVLAIFFITNVAIYDHPLGAHSFQVFDNGSFFSAKLVHITRIWQAFQTRLIRTFPLLIWFLALSIPLILAQRRSPHILWLYLVIVGFYVLVPWFLPNAGGRQWGPRYLLILFPMLTMLLAYQIDYVVGLHYQLLKILLGALYVVCLGVGVIVNTYHGAQILTDDYSLRVKPLLQELRQTDTPYIAINSQYIQQELVALYEHKIFFLVQGGDDLTRLAMALKERGIHDMLFITFWQPQPSQFSLRTEGGEGVAKFRHQGTYGDYDLSLGTF